MQEISCTKMNHESSNKFYIFLFDHTCIPFFSEWKGRESNCIDVFTVIVLVSLLELHFIDFMEQNVTTW
jgi:hypothetical protein